MSQPKTIVVATHRRSGTHWTIDALRNNSRDINDKFLTLEQTEPTHHQPIPLDEFQAELESLSERVLIKVHDLPTPTFWKSELERLHAETIMQNSPTVYVHRDGRDVMVSLYYYMKSIQDDYANLSFSEFLRMNHELDGNPMMSRPAFWAHHVSTWLTRPNLIAIGYEALERDYETTVRRMADFLNIGLNPVLQPIYLHQPKSNLSMMNRLLKKIGIKPDKVSSAVAPRKGTSGDWRTHFSDEDLAFFMDEAGDMMRQLGYVDSDQ